MFETWPPDVQVFLSLVDEIQDDPHVPTMATMLLKGRLTLLRGAVWQIADHATRIELLRHEAGHVGHGSWMRVVDRDREVYNVADDAIIHELGECDWALIDVVLKPLGGRTTTLARLADEIGQSLNLMPVERLYDILMEARGDLGQGCGSCQHSKHDDSTLSKIKAIQVGRAVGLSGGKHRLLAPTLPPVPNWIGQVLNWLITTSLDYDSRYRSWRRPHRTLPDLYPGIGHMSGRKACIMLDASGSISEALLAQFLAALVDTPELRGSHVVVFDDETRDPIPLTDMDAILTACRGAGGGTCIAAAGNMRDPECQTVWLTDGESGDGWPTHPERDCWVVGKDDPAPEGAYVVRRV